MNFVSAENSNMINIKEAIPIPSGLNLSYSFDKLNLVGGSVSIAVWINNKEGAEIQRIADSFPINKDGLIERNILIKLPNNLTGIYSVNLALPPDFNNFVNQSFVLERPQSITGNSILDIFDRYPLNYTIIFLILFIFIAIGIFFKMNENNKQSNNEQKSISQSI